MDILFDASAIARKWGKAMEFSRAVLTMRSNSCPA
jgi:hypothetical protein